MRAKIKSENIRNAGKRFLRISKDANAASINVMKNLGSQLRLVSRVSKYSLVYVLLQEGIRCEIRFQLCKFGWKRESIQMKLFLSPFLVHILYPLKLFYFSRIISNLPHRAASKCFYFHAAAYFPWFPSSLLVEAKQEQLYMHRYWLPFFFSLSLFLHLPDQQFVINYRQERKFTDRAQTVIFNEITVIRSRHIYSIIGK